MHKSTGYVLYFIRHSAAPFASPASFPLKIYIPIAPQVGAMKSGYFWYGNTTSLLFKIAHSGDMTIFLNLYFNRPKAFGQG